MKEDIFMTTKEVSRAEVFSELQKKALNQIQAAHILGLGDRQVRRLFKSYKSRGPIALVSKKEACPVTTNYRRD